MRELNRKMATGALWTTSLRFSVRALGLISTVILARLLVPADFGLVAMATSVVAFLELASAFSFDIPLIQKQDADRRHYDTAWTLNLLFYLGLTVLLILLARPAAAFYQEERLTPVIYVLAVGFLVNGFENIGVVNFRKELDFRKEFILLFSKKLAGFVVAIPLALYLRSYWALVIGIVVGNIIGVALTYLLHPFRPRFGVSAAAEMLSFSKWLIANNALGFLRIRSPDFVVGRISGSSSLGLFSIAFEISTLATTELVAPINRVALPGYSKLAGDLQSLKESYLDVLAIVAFLALPASFGISAVAVPLIDLFLGNKWAAAAPLVAILAIFGGINAIQTNSGSVFIAIGKPYLVTVVGVINVTLLLCASIPLALKYGPMGVAAAYLGAFTLLAPVSFYLVCREIEAGPSELLNVLWRPIMASLAMYGSLTCIGGLLSSHADLSSFTMLAVLVPAGALVYALIVLLLWGLAGKPKSAEYRLANIALRKIRSS